MLQPIYPRDEFKGSIVRNDKNQLCEFSWINKFIK